MSDEFAAIIARSRAWFETTHQAGWLDQADLARLAAVEHGTPADLFVDRQARPLVVAFFGGTGVGKSSLLNRLAGEAIARTGVERPTSREVTVYVHESVELADLPPELPVEPVRIKRHSSAPHRNVLWIDAPDIDSTIETHRSTALAWLPHVDLVCYVVSPERYRDDVGWRVVRQRGHKHAWMFVLNRWDEGDPRQVDDFARMLNDAGFENPLLLCTCCLGGRTLPTPDQFDEIQAALTSLLQTHGVRELTRLGHRARLEELRDALTAAEQRIGTDALWEQLTTDGRTRWEGVAGTIRAGAEWSLRAAAGHFAAREGGVGGWLQRGLSVARGATSRPGATDVGASQSARTPAVAPDSHAPAASIALDFVEQLWDDWAQSKLTAWLDATELELRRRGLAVEPLRRRLDDVAKWVADGIAHSLRDEVRAALAHPGNALGRIARHVTGFMMAVLPAAALLWVAWAVVRGFAAATATGKPYLGVDFAVHSLLLVLLAWAIPFAIDRALRPSLEQTVLRALRAGLQAGLDDASHRLEQAMRQNAGEARECHVRARELLARVNALMATPLDMEAPPLARLLARVG